LGEKEVTGAGVTGDDEFPLRTGDAEATAVVDRSASGGVGHEGGELLSMPP
jgi:hypothetical protein